MSVYVDDMRAPLDQMIMCHMVADSEDELHEMASRIGILARWYRGDHYDVSLGKRARAVKLGAIEITMRDAARIRRTMFQANKRNNND